MGILDFVKSGVKEIAIARPNEAKEFLVYKHPDPTIPMYGQLTVYADEVAVFFRDGVVVGGMAAGRHTLDSKNIPFLSNLVDSFTGGNVFRAEVFFVLTRLVTDVKFGGRLPPILDPYSGEMIQPRVNGSFAVRVTDPVKLVTDFIGTRQATNDQALQFIKEQLMIIIKSALGELAESQNKSLLQIAALTDDLSDEFVKRSPTRLGAYGLTIVQMGDYNINFSPEDEKTLRAAISEMAKADRGIRIAKAEAEARRAHIAVDLERDKQYSDLAGGFGTYAAGKAMLGAGEGMAKGGGEGGGGGAMGMGAQLGVGMAMMGQMAQAAQGAMTPKTAAPPAAPAAPAAMAAVVCPACKATVAPGKFCAECGGGLAPAKRFCADCGAEMPGTGKFCPGCGAKSA
ncbi:MAG: SPFH domain-containing protein [Deltaproteobacteria bacterium]|nr:SPFH domain-containing protein [Deltaproteobacteria bacterium]